MKERRLYFCTATYLILLTAIVGSALAYDFPAAPKQPVTNSYFGTEVVDNYIWLENFNDPAVKAWNAAENKVSRAFLDGLPARTEMAERLTTLGIHMQENGTAAYAKFMQEDLDRYTKVVNEVHLQIKP